MALDRDGTNLAAASNNWFFIVSVIMNDDASISGRKQSRVGFELIGDMYLEDRSYLDDIVFCVDALREAARMAQLDIRAEVHHKFSPQGVTVALILAESHLILSTWPEYEYASINMFSCTTVSSCVAALLSLARSLRSINVSGHIIERPQGRIVSFNSLAGISDLAMTIWNNPLAP